MSVRSASGATAVCSRPMRHLMGTVILSAAKDLLVRFGSSRSFAALRMTACFAAIAGAQETAIIPRPVSLVRGKGTFTLTARTTIFANRGDSAVATRFARALAPATGLVLPVKVDAAPAGNRVVFRRAAARDTTF